MKKLFTILAAALFSVSMMAEDYALISGSFNSEKTVATVDGLAFTVDPAHGGATGTNNYAEYGTDAIKFSSKKTYTITLPDGFKATKVNLKGYSNDDTNNSSIVEFNGNTQSGKDFLARGTEGIKTQACVTTGYDFALTGEESSFSFKTGNKQLALLVTITGTLTPASDPVTVVTISGASECYVDKTITLTASTDVNANAYKWAVDGVDQEDSNAKNFNFTPAAEGTYSIICYAMNANNSDWAASAPHSVVATIKTDLTQVDVTAATIWDWTKAATVSEIKFTDSTDPKKNEDVLLANLDGFNNDANFNSQALIFSGEYAVRDGKYCQGQRLQFHTTIAGYVKVEFSNTGGGDRPNRYIAVNGTVNTTVGSNTGTKVESAYIPVAAGDVTIEGSFETYELQYLRIYKVTFGVGEVPTAVENAEVGEKAVKVIENGQLVIIKNGVKYSIIGAEIR